MEEYSHLSSGSNTMRPLIDLANEAYLDVKGELPYYRIQEFITDDAKSVEFIRSILQDDEFNMPSRGDLLYNLAKARARHSAITFLIGLVLFKFENFERMILDSSYMQRTDGHTAAVRLWMLTALYHDYGYSLTDIRNAEIGLKSKIKYYLLDDTYPHEQLKILRQFSTCHEDALAYTYDEIEEYDKCSRRWGWRQRSEEKVDHGILGGVRIFDRLVKRAIKEFPINSKELIAIKTSCLTIAQHNIFKSESKETDNYYGDTLTKLYYASPFVIDNCAPLLLLLSLVDTFECVKKLSKGENEKQYLKTLSILSSISLRVSQEELTIDFSKLDKRIQDKNSEILKTAYMDYKQNLLKLEHWTSFAIDESESEIMKIRIDSPKHLNSSHIFKTESKGFAYA